ncbi:MAG: DNA mismatch repair protein MutS [Tepidisphaera sp.]|nr:DNA mismatch repair protein MutS [Tepidisphaera sp.]
MPDPRETPAMQQYYRFKQRHPGCVLLFRIGDFYEMFDDDAVAVSKAIGLTLTQRTQGVPMAGVPFHQLDNYVRKMLGAGFRVAVAEQLIDSSQAKGVVPRAVTRVLSPGTLVDESLIETQDPGALAAISFTSSGDDSPAAIAVVEVSTGQFTVLSCDNAAIVDELARRGVREVLYSDTAEIAPTPRVQRVLSALRLAGTPRATWHFRHSEALDALREHYGVSTLAGFGLADDAPEVGPAGAALRYLRETQTLSDEDLKGVSGVNVARATLKHLHPPRREDPSAHCVIDAVSLRSLEIETTLRAGAADGSLVGVFLGAGKKNLLRTGMGRRLLRDWLCRPLRDAAAIRARQHAVATFVEDRVLADTLGDLLAGVQDTPRILARLAMARATPRDLVGLATSLARTEALLDAIEGVPALAELAATLGSATPTCQAAERVVASCLAEPPAHMREGGLIKDGVDADLDESRLIQRDAGAWLAEYQKRLIETHNLPGLKVGFNRVFGYYIELPQAQAKNAPAALERTQTLRSAERFTTPELRDFERKATGAEARAIERERELFQNMCDGLAAFTREINAFSHAVATLDALLAFAEKAVQRGWKRPEIVDEPSLMIHAGRHPVLDESLGGEFVPNDCELGLAGKAALALITGPNMAGKSTFIRQTALITLLAHAGSFVPADRATIGVVDRIFTRIGADDALHAGQSTFMVEMIETANILNHATPRSLVVLDEVGRGTSTLDGLSLAWAIVEHLAGAPGQPGPRTLFATHYHELTDLEEQLQGQVQNLHVAVREWPQGGEHAEIVFLHRILPGRTDQSYGLHVARLAGMPAPVIARGREVLASLAVQHAGKPSIAPASRHHDSGGQFSLFTEYLGHPAIDSLREIKLEKLSPMQAFDELRRLKAQVETGANGSR